MSKTLADMTPEQARELLDTATPGPWHVAMLDLHRDTGVIDNEHAQSNQRLAALAPELAADWLRLREENARLLLSRDKHARDSLRIIKYFRDHHPEAHAQFAENLHAILEGETNG